MELEKILKKQNLSNLKILNNSMVNFEYKDFYVHFFIYQDVMYGEAYKKNIINDTEQLRYCRFLFFPSKKEREEFEKEAGYIHFILEGNLKRNIKNLIRLLETPKENIFLLEDKKGTVFLKNNEDIRRKINFLRLRNFINKKKYYKK
ncbi:MAG: hypothetical protein QW117_02525 [Candidatus Pacearchaeota archaeon]